jgi:hypothetical protein
MPGMAMRNCPSKKPRSRLFFSVDKDIIPPAARPVKRPRHWKHGAMSQINQPKMKK